VFAGWGLNLLVGMLCATSVARTAPAGGLLATALQPLSVGCPSGLRPIQRDTRSDEGCRTGDDSADDCEELGKEGNAAGLVQGVISLGAFERKLPLRGEPMKSGGGLVLKSALNVDPALRGSARNRGETWTLCSISLLGVAGKIIAIQTIAPKRKDNATCPVTWMACEMCWRRRHTTETTTTRERLNPRLSPFRRYRQHLDGR